MKTLQTRSLTLLFLLLLAGCSLPARPVSSPSGSQAEIATVVAMTLEALRTRQPAVFPAVNNTPIPTTAPTRSGPTATITPTITPTYSLPMLSFDGNTNCRQGPGTEYKVVVVLKQGQKIEPVGMQANYWIVKVPGGEGTCWVAGDYATPSGSVWALPTVTTPPPPTREPPAAPTWSKWNYTCAYATGGYTLTMEMLWTDRASNETGYKVYRNGEVIATLPADASSYTDSAFLETGKTFSYYVQAYSDSGSSETSKVDASCQ